MDHCIWLCNYTVSECFIVLQFIVLHHCGILQCNHCSSFCQWKKVRRKKESLLDGRYISTNSVCVFLVGVVLEVNACIF